MDPSEFHLSKPMEGNKKQGKDHIFHAQHITYPHFIWDSTGSCGGKLFKGHVKAENQEPWCCTATQGSTQAPHVHAGKLFVLRNQVTPESRQCFFFFFHLHPAGDALSLIVFAQKETCIQRQRSTTTECSFKVMPLNTNTCKKTWC